MNNIRRTKELLMGMALVCAVTLSFTSCEEEDDDYDLIPLAPTTGNIINSNIKAGQNVTWTKDNIYELAGRIVVEDGATLTIEAGTIIKAQPGQQTSAKALLIARGGKLFANGTATEPIIMTTTLDQIQQGQVSSPNLGPDVQGQWGGLIILGKARISSGVTNGNSFDIKQIDGIPPTDINGEYGGNQDADNSGSVTYVSIRHGGTNIGNANEINGLTLGGVGSGTIINNIEVVANKDDGIEIFGGTVSISDVVVWNNGDDAIDTDQAWNGILDNFAIVGPTGSPFELDGPEGTYINGNHTIRNGAIVSQRPDGAKAEDLINYDENSNVDLENLTFTSIATGQLVNSKNRTTATNVTFLNILLDVPSANLGDYISTAAHTNPIPVAITSGNTSQFDKTKLTWTWTSISGALDGL